MRIAILCNGKTLTRWQREAVRQISAGHDIYLLACTDQAPPSRRIKNALYYALNLFTIKNSRSRLVSFPDAEFRSSGKLEFSCSFEKNWAVLPEDVLKWIGEHRIDAVVKFGLDLLRVPPQDRLPVPILSFHHGDPRSFRGRPAGFYEILQGRKFLGQIVQRLSNSLDAGNVLAFAETRVEPSSYRKTLIAAYTVSPYLLPKALDAVRTGREEPMEPSGAVYRLPSNRTVLVFLAMVARNWFRRIRYGAFVEKRWRVSRVQVSEPTDPIALLQEVKNSRASWSDTKLLPGFIFYADPFFHTASDDYLVEALNSRTGKGELVRVRAEQQTRISGFAGHVSYPAAILDHGAVHVVPEISGWSRPAVYRIVDDRAEKVAELDLNEREIVDPTPFRHAGRVYLFGNRKGEGGTVLRLWHAPSLFARFEEHPASPIRIGARGSRMAGTLLRVGPDLYRLGQDCRNGYGDGLVVFRIDSLGPSDYRERQIDLCAFDEVSGPHTFSRHGDTVLFDWYTDRFSLLAGVRRVLNRL